MSVTTSKSPKLFLQNAHHICIFGQHMSVKIVLQTNDYFGHRLHKIISNFYKNASTIVFLSWKNILWGPVQFSVRPNPE